MFAMRLMEIHKLERAMTKRMSIKDAMSRKSGVVTRRARQAGVVLVIALIALVSWLAYGQKLDGPALLGIALIVAGVVVLNLFSASTRH